VDLLEKLADGSARVGVIGLGYAGLPLAIEMARAGYRVTGFDIDEEKIRCLRSGTSYVTDVKASDLEPLVKAGLLDATADFTLLEELDAVSICVPTPLSKTREPDISFIVAAAETLRRHLHPQMLVVLESTTYPGTTEEVVQPLLESTGLKAGTDFYLAFSPERVDPGNQRFQTRNTPRILGGITRRCAEVALSFYSRFIDTVVPVSSARAAEMIKLLENTFRAVNIGLVNEFAIICNKLDLDVWEIVEAAATKPFGFMKFTPGPGLGGHCIPIDPQYLSWKMRSLNYTARFIELADQINSQMPALVVEKTSRLLNSARKCLNGANVLVLGVAYKPDVPDYRESPALTIIPMLQEHGAEVDYCDPHVPEVSEHGRTMRSVPLDARTFLRYDCVIITTNHSCFDYQRLLDESKLVLDCRNATTGLHGKATVVKL
jgi:UDP-N-acetyl-D-glucosamine dehydrogenase